MLGNNEEMKGIKIIPIREVYKGIKIKYNRSHLHKTKEKVFISPDVYNENIIRLDDL